MKLMFIADIHGSHYYAQKGLEAYHREQADYLILLGDQLYHGARNPLPQEYNPREVAPLLNQYADRIIAVKGNCDSEVDEMVLSFPIMSPSAIVLYEGRRLFLTHGHVYNDKNLPPLSKGDLLIFGHTHIPKAEKISLAEKKDGISDEVFVINPGSLSLPKENNPHTYGVLEKNIFRIKDVSGNIFKEMII